MKPYIAQIRSSLRLMGRDRSVLIFSYLFPLVFFFLFAQLYSAGQSAAAMGQVFAMVLIIGILGNGFFGAGMRAVQDRETNVLRRFKVAPIGPAPIIVASLVSGLVGFLPTVFLFLLFSKTIYHMPVPANLPSLLIFVCLGVIAFRSMGMIVASTVNSAQEGGLVTQILYLPMMFLSGATFPVSIMPSYVQTIAQFLPATYLFGGVQSIMVGGESITKNLSAVVGLLITLCLAVFVGIKLFRWEKEEKISGRAKLWIVAVLAPFIIMGLYQARTKENIQKARILTRNAIRNRTTLYQNARVFIGDGSIIENGSVLIRNGKIEKVFTTPTADIKSTDADVIDVSGKTILPGLIDMHVHIGAPGGVFADTASYVDPTAPQRRLAAYLYSGITTVRSTGDWLNSSLKLRQMINSGEYQGAEFFACGPLFTAEGGHPTEMIKNFPASMKATATEQFVRLPKSVSEARGQVDALKTAGVDCVKSVLDSGYASWQIFNRLDPGIYRAIINEAVQKNLPTATHTGKSEDVKLAVETGTNSVEHGSMTDLIPPEVFAQMKSKGIAYDPTLSVFEAVADLNTGNPEPLNRSLIQQVGPAKLLDATRAMLDKQKNRAPADAFQAMLSKNNQNLLQAYKSGVLLISGSDAGNMLVIHGPTIQHELELWVKAGIPAAVALQAATYNAAKVLHAENRIGSIEPGREATLIVVDGDPLQDISLIERIAAVMVRGGRVDRGELLHQENP